MQEQDRGRILPFSRPEEKTPPRTYTIAASEQAVQRRTMTIPSLDALYDEDAITLGSGKNIASYRRSLVVFSEEEQRTRVVRLEEDLFVARAGHISEHAQTLPHHHQMMKQLGRHTYRTALRVGDEAFLRHAETAMVQIFGSHHGALEMEHMVDRHNHAVEE